MSPLRLPRPGSPNRDSNYFLQYNANKRSVAVNLKDPRGVELVKAMAKQAGVPFLFISAS